MLGWRAKWFSPLSLSYETIIQLRSESNLIETATSVADGAVDVQSTQKLDQLHTYPSTLANFLFPRPTNTLTTTLKVVQTLLVAFLHVVKVPIPKKRIEWMVGWSYHKCNFEIFVKYLPWNNAFWPTTEVGEADSVSSVAASACHSSRPKDVTPRYCT